MEQNYKIYYEKTYASGSTEWYESSVEAQTLEVAVKKAHAKLQYKDMMATWSTNITDAYLCTPAEEKIFLLYSKQIQEGKTDKAMIGTVYLDP